MKTRIHSATQAIFFSKMLDPVVGADFLARWLRAEIGIDTAVTTRFGISFRAFCENYSADAVDFLTISDEKEEAVSYAYAQTTGIFLDKKQLSAAIESAGLFLANK